MKSGGIPGGVMIAALATGWSTCLAAGAADELAGACRAAANATHGTLLVTVLEAKSVIQSVPAPYQPVYGTQFLVTDVQARVDAQEGREAPAAGETVTFFTAGGGEPDDPEAWFWVSHTSVQWPVGGQFWIALNEQPADPAVPPFAGGLAGIWQVHSGRAYPLGELAAAPALSSSATAPSSEPPPPSVPQQVSGSLTRFAADGRMVVSVTSSTGPPVLQPDDPGIPLSEFLEQMRLCAAAGGSP